MLGCAVALVTLKAVLWVGERLGAHQPIARDLSDDARSGDRTSARVAFDEWVLRGGAE